ncbi:helix-turn-helix domain-containing protein [Oceanobacillus oncorhynchi]|uniref:helix-turn-helix domain-containing protein n=1 Tax=Oceanobacillus oncorhynchi TaxID=545501 RepID=UPI0034D3E811
MNNNKIGTQLRALRKSKKMSTQELADKVSVSQSYISKFENGHSKPDIEMLENILKALDSNLSSFFASELEEMPDDLIVLMNTLKTLSPEARRKLNEFLEIVRE